MKSTQIIKFKKKKNDDAIEGNMNGLTFCRKNTNNKEITN